MAFSWYDPYFDDGEEGYDYSDSSSSIPSDIDWENNNFYATRSQSPNYDSSILSTGLSKPGSFDLGSVGNPNRRSNLLGNVTSAVSKLNRPAPQDDDPNSAYGQYRSAILQAPSPDQYAPSKLRRIGAAAAGIGAALATKNPLLGMNISENITNRPYEQAEKNWEAKVGKLKLAADEERQTNQSRFTQQKDIAASGLANQKEQRELLNTLSEIRSRDSQTGLNNANIARIQNDLKNPDVELVKTDDGFLTAVSKKGGNIIKQYGKVNLSKEETEKLSSGLQLRNMLANTGAQGQNQLALEDARSKNDSALEDQRETNREKLKKVAPALANPKAISQDELNKRTNKAMEDILRTPRGSQYDKFFTTDSTGRRIPNQDEIRVDPTGWQTFQNFVQRRMDELAPTYKGY